MYWAKDMIPMNGNLFVVKRRFRHEPFQKVLTHFGSKTICENYHCETVIKGGDGFFYLCDKVDDAQII
jgi:hypothetical protein